MSRYKGGTADPWPEGRPGEVGAMYLLLFVIVVVIKSCPTFCDPMDYSSPGSSVWDFPGKNIGVSCHFLLQGIFPTQGLNHLLLGRQILYH